jgi:uncharacterized protein (DUF2344 family)
MWMFLMTLLMNLVKSASRSINFVKNFIKWTQRVLELHSSLVKMVKKQEKSHLIFSFGKLRKIFS